MPSGADKSLCGAQLPNAPAGTLCRTRAGFRTDHFGFGACYRHGGATRAHRVHAGLEKAEHDARAILAHQDITPVTDPVAELQILGGEVREHRLLMARLANELEQWTQSNKLDVEDMRAVLLAYERAMDRSASLLTAMVKLDLQAVMVRLHAGQAAKVLHVIESTLRSLSLTPAQVELARSTAVRELRLVSEPIDSLAETA